MAEKVENDEICGEITARYDKNIRRIGRKIISAKNTAGTERLSAVRFSAQMPVRKYILRREHLDFPTKYGQITSILPTNHLILPVINWLFYPIAQKEIGKKSTKAGIAVEISAGW